MSDFNDLPLDIRKQIDLMVTTGTADIKFDDMDKILQGQDVENDSGNETISGENVDISSSVYKPVKLSSELDCLDIDQFIAAMCVPPPPDHRVTDALQACPPTSTDSVVGVVNDTRPDNARLNDFQELQTTTSPPNHINSSPGQTHTTSPAIAHKPAITRAKPILAPLPVTSSTTSANPCEIPAVVETDSVVPLWKQLLTPVTSPSHAPSTPLHAHTDITNSRTTVDGHDQSAIAGADIKVNGPQSGANGVGEHVRDTNSTNSRSVNFKHNGQESEQKYNGVQVVTCSSIVGERLAAINNATRDRLPPGHDSHTTNGFTPHPRLNGSASELNDSRCRDDRLQYSSCSGSSPASRLNSCANDSGIQSRNRSQTSEGDTLPLTPEELALLEATPPFLVTPTAAAATTTTVVYDTPTPVETCVVMRRKNKSPPITPTHYSAIVNAYAEPANDVLNSSPTSCQTLSRRSGGQTSLVDPHYSTLPHFPRNHHSTSEIPPPLEEQRIAREPRIRHKAPVPPRRYSSLECDQVAGRSQTQRSAPNSTRHAPSVGHAHKPAPPPRRGSKLLRDSEIIYDKPQLNHQGPISPCTSTSSTSSSNYQNNNGYCSVTLRKNRSRSIDRRKFSSFFAEDDDSLSNMSMTSSMTSHGSTEEVWHKRSSSLDTRRSHMAPRQNGCRNHYPLASESKPAPAASPTDPTTTTTATSPNTSEDGSVIKACRDVDRLLSDIARSMSSPNATRPLDPSAAQTAGGAGVNMFADLSRLARQFVGDSKRLVSNATKDRKLLTGCLQTGGATLTQMVSRCRELPIARHRRGGAPTHVLLLSLVKDVASAYRETLRAADRAAGLHLNSEPMKTLMRRATELAAALSHLLKTLKSFKST